MMYDDKVPTWLTHHSEFIGDGLMCRNDECKYAKHTINELWKRKETDILVKTC